MKDSEGRKVDETRYKCFVVMTDPFLSEWGKADGKQNKLVFLCNSYEEAEVVTKNAERRDDMNRITTHNSVPYYNKKNYYVQFKAKEDYPEWFEVKPPV
jgi:hypothetical protein